MTLKPYVTRVSIILLAVATAACEPGLRTRTLASHIEVKQMEPGEAKCACEGAVRYQISNTGNAADVLAGHRFSRLITSSEDFVESQPLRITIRPNQNIPLECSVKPDAQKVCNTSVAYELNGVSYPNPITEMSRQLVVNTVSAHTAPFKVDLSPSNACLNACISDGGSCLTIDASNSTDAKVGREIAGLMGNLVSDSTIGNKKIMGLTKSGKNECSRTDVAFKDGIGYNFGNECEIRGVLPAGGGNVSIVVPASFVTNYSKLGAGNFDMKFFKSKAAPRVTFTKPDYQGTFGGSVKQINFHADRFIMQNEGNNCFALKVR